MKKRNEIKMKDEITEKMTQNNDRTGEAFCEEKNKQEGKNEEEESNEEMEIGSSNGQEELSEDSERNKGQGPVQEQGIYIPPFQIALLHTESNRKKKTRR